MVDEFVFIKEKLKNEWSEVSWLGWLAGQQTYNP